jgi:hypothetical protein
MSDPNTAPKEAAPVEAGRIAGPAKARKAAPAKAVKPAATAATAATAAPASSPKPPKEQKPAKATRASKPAHVAAPKRQKLVRDSFTIPKDEYEALGQLKLRANGLATPAKKSELLRAGIKALVALSDAGFLAALKRVPALKTGRPTAELPTDEAPAGKRAKAQAK